jgi:hypothetical protein
LLVEAPLDRAQRNVARERVGGKRLCCPAKNKSRELIEDDDQRERALGGSFPAGEVVDGRRLERRQKAPPHFRVEFRIGLKPPFGAGGLPEGENGLRVGNCARHG